MRSLIFVMALWAGGQAQAADRAAEGRALVERNCARCHAIGRMDESPNDEAPPFRRLHERYPIESLAEAFAEGIVVGHKDMPAFEFSPQEIDALVAYINSLGERRKAR